jgi:hypothetical protein
MKLPLLFISVLVVASSSAQINGGAHRPVSPMMANGGGYHSSRSHRSHPSRSRRSWKHSKTGGHKKEAVELIEFSSDDAGPELVVLEPSTEVVDEVSTKTSFANKDTTSFASILVGSVSSMQNPQVQRTAKNHGI